MERALQLRDERATLVRTSMSLVMEFNGLTAGSVIACVVRCRDELERAGVREGLATATLAMARTRLTDGANRLGLAG